jgi:hypothetical protein
VKYEYILEKTEHPVSRWAVSLQISKSGYYAWRKSHKVRKSREKNIKKRIRDEFEKSRMTYGPDRIVAELRKSGEKVGRRRCVTYMKEMGLKSVHRQSFPPVGTTIRKSPPPSEIFRLLSDGFSFLIIMSVSLLVFICWYLQFNTLRYPQKYHQNTMDCNRFCWTRVDKRTRKACIFIGDFGLYWIGLDYEVVPGGGIEPSTHGFSVHIYKM